MIEFETTNLFSYFFTYLVDIYNRAIEGEKQAIIFWICFYTFIVALYSVYYQLKVRSWPRTKGRLKKAAIEKFGGTEWTKSNQDYKTTVEYEYNVDGKTYEGSRVSPWIIVASYNAKSILNKQLKSIRKFNDRTIEVLYNPNNPKKCYLIEPSKTGVVITITIAISPLLLYIYSYHL